MPPTVVSASLAAPLVPTTGPGRVVALLRTSHFLRGVPAPVIDKLAAHATVRDLAVGARLWREGDVATGFGIFAAGLVTIRRSLASGAEVIVAIFGSRENVGDTAALEGSRYPAEAVVSSESATVIKVDAQRVLEQSALCPALALALQQALCRHAAALRTKVEILSAGTVRARLANLFLHLASRFGDELADGTVAVPVALSRTTLASLVSARTETVIRALRPWERAGVVVTEGGRFVLGDLPTLTACAAEG